ncbi:MULTISPECIES: hypothetical protein [Kyrpidia]|uniref:Metal-dependent hydrolase n=2 Tax=Kyrpidia spormannii TaxID=2055160 RepID=A0A6F9E5P7_9BACL|nr:MULTISPECIES: hypothetical protein [Kyrpidia]MCL6575580.1 hypothetical protein [Kyrpidia sp.]CAB3390913.1 conserved membrane protein of unknown function [Kyrpidia spormannii]CAB3391821.1 conserved membrane protein of unknown function [Kyrpidia spormannii]
MDTLGHGFWMYAIFRKRRDVPFLVAGALAPDLWLWSAGLFMILTGRGGTLLRQGLDGLMGRPWVFAGDSLSHSLPLWSAVMVAALIGRFRAAAAVAAGAGLHIAVDLFTHRQFAPAYLYPFWSRPIAGWVESGSWWFVGGDLAAMAAVFLFHWLRQRDTMKTG